MPSAAITGAVAGAIAGSVTTAGLAAAAHFVPQAVASLRRKLNRDNLSALDGGWYYGELGNRHELISVARCIPSRRLEPREVDVDAAIRWVNDWFCDYLTATPDYSGAEQVRFVGASSEARLLFFPNGLVEFALPLEPAPSAGDEVTLSAVGMAVPVATLAAAVSAGLYRDLYAGQRDARRQLTWQLNVSANFSAPNVGIRDWDRVVFPDSEPRRSPGATNHDYRRIIVERVRQNVAAEGLIVALLVQFLERRGYRAVEKPAMSVASVAVARSAESRRRVVPGLNDAD